MRIKSLIVRETVPTLKNIRTLNFCLDGANFIVDKNNIDERETGNSIGKSTVAKIIDLCFSAKSVTSLYTDNETKNKDLDIEDYLTKHKAEAVLELVSEDNQLTILTSALFPRGYRKINNQKFLEKDYLCELNKIIFDLKELSPTFKQLISKFVRINSNLDEHIFKFLSFAPNSVYESIYSFLFKLASNDIVAQKASLEAELQGYKRITDSYKRTKKLQSLELLEQKLLTINNELMTIKANRLEGFQSDEDYIKEVENNRLLLAEINSVNCNIDAIITDIKLLKEAIVEQTESTFENNNEKLKVLYGEAVSAISGISKSFDELVAFHNSMILSKIKFLESQIENKEKILIELRTKLSSLTQRKNIISAELLDNGLLAEYNLINKKIEELSIEKGEIENSLSIWNENESMLDVARTSLKVLGTDLFDQLSKRQ